MPQSLSRRFNGSGDEVVAYALANGVESACEKYHVGYIAMSKFLEQRTGEKRAGVCPAIRKDIPLGEQVLQALLNEMDRLKRKIEVLTNELESYRRTKDFKEENNVIRAYRIMEKIK